VIGQSSAMWMAAITAALLLLAGSATLMALVVVHLERRRKELAVRTANSWTGLARCRGWRRCRSGGRRYAWMRRASHFGGR
jgi:hypothetical protein